MLVDVEQATEGIGEVEEDPQHLSLSLSSMVGLSAPHSLKIRGRIKDREVIVLIDSRASHNFISTTLVEELGLEMSQTKEFGVILGTGVEIRTFGVCWKIKLHVAELEVIYEFFFIPLGSSEVILGYQWLASLGESCMNWGRMSMKFKMGNTRVHLQGDSSLCKTQVSLQSMVCTIHHEGQGILLDFGQLSLLLVEGALSTSESLPQFTLPEIEKDGEFLIFIFHTFWFTPSSST